MLCSILIANYNNGKYFKDCVDSLINQTYTNWEAIVVDDSSNDDSINIIKEIIRSDSRFKFYVNDKNEGCGFTKRRAAELANGEIVGYLDPDDALLPNAIELMVNVHREKPEICLVHSSLFYCDENLNSIGEYKNAKMVEVDKSFTNLNNAVTAFATFKKEFYSLTEGINSRLNRAVDQDLYLKLSEQGSFYFLDQILYKYRLHSNGIATSDPFKAIYAHLKTLADAEKRRGVNFESQISQFLSDFCRNSQTVPQKNTIFSRIKKRFFKTINLMTSNHNNSNI